MEEKWFPFLIFKYFLLMHVICGENECARLRCAAFKCQYVAGIQLSQVK